MAVNVPRSSTLTRVLLLVVLLSGERSSGENICDNDSQVNWSEFEGNCYFLVEEKLDWYEARKECTSKGADLASIHSNEENTFVADLVAHNSYSYQDFWIGFHELSVDSFEWSDKTDSTKYEHFASREPNGNGGENCVTSHTNSEFWNDLRCTTKLRSVCKKWKGEGPPPDLPHELKGLCPTGFRSEAFTNKCFYVSSEEETWEDADKACKIKNPRAELAAIVGVKDQAFVTLLIKEIQEKDVWIGFSNHGYTKDDSNWIDNIHMTYTHWEPRLPSWYRDGKKTCGIINRKTKIVPEIGTWSHELCSERKPYLCQALRVPGDETDGNPFEDEYNTAKCGSKAFLYQGRCYHFFNYKKTWADARKYCRNRAAKLAVVFDAFEGARMEYEALNKDGTHSPFWIDIKFNQDLDDYAWGEDSRRIIDAKRFWKKGWTEPETHGCLAFYDGYWSEEPCSEKKTFFCVVGDFDEYIPQTIENESGHCENSDAEPFGSKCYWIPKTKKATWTEADEECRTMGMTLTSIHNKDEVAFLVKLFSERRQDTKMAWIGLESESTGDFRWSDTSDYDFPYWATREPNSYSEQCVEMNENGLWNDVMCDGIAAFICSKDNVISVEEQLGGPQKSAEPDDDTQKPEEQVEQDDDTQKPEEQVEPDDDTQKPEEQVKPDDDTQKPTEPSDSETDEPVVELQTPGDKPRKPVQPSDRIADGDQNSKQKFADKAEGDKMSGGAIAGVVFGVLAGLALTAVTLMFVYRRWPLWRLQTILRGNSSSDTRKFEHAIYGNHQVGAKKGEENVTFA